MTLDPTLHEMRRIAQAMATAAKEVHHPALTTDEFWEHLAKAAVSTINLIEQIKEKRLEQDDAGAISSA
jgi:hypothetical protein